MLDPADSGLHVGMRCIYCRIGRSVHLYWVTGKEPMSACEMCTRRSGLDLDDTDLYGETTDSGAICPCCGQAGGVVRTAASITSRVDQSCENCHNPET
jgi:hypothetical protein